MNLFDVPKTPTFAALLKDTLTSAAADIILKERRRALGTVRKLCEYLYQSGMALPMPESIGLKGQALALLQEGFDNAHRLRQDITAIREKVDATETPAAWETLDRLHREAMELEHEIAGWLASLRTS